MTPFGTATLFGTYDDANAPTITLKVGGVSAVAKIQAAKFDWKTASVVEKLNDGNGKPVGFNRVRSVRTLSIDAVVRADTKAHARTAIRPPDDMTVVTLANVIAAGDTFLNGDWGYEEGAGVALSDEGEANLKFDVYQYLDSAGNVIAPATLMAAVV
jgi:hypothetical protein